MLRLSNQVKPRQPLLAAIWKWKWREAINWGCTTSLNGTDNSTDWIREFIDTRVCIRGFPAVSPRLDIKAGLKWARFVLDCFLHAKFEVYAAHVCCVATLSRQVSSTLEEGGIVSCHNVATLCSCDRAPHYRRPRSRLQRYKIPILNRNLFAGKQVQAKRIYALLTSYIKQDGYELKHLAG